MVEMSATIDGAATAAFNAAFQEFAKSLGDGIAKAPQRAAISVCKNFRAATKKAPARARAGEYTITKSDTAPKHVTSKTHGDLRRWTLNRSPVNRGVYDVYEAKRSDVRKNKLILFHRGLAQQSWGWVMHNIFNGAAPDTPWHRRKNDRRNPKDATRDSYSKTTPSVTMPHGVARICNRLGYIGDALKISVDAILTKAANKMIRPIINARLRAGGMSAAEIKTAGHDIHQDWMRQFAS